MKYCQGIVSELSKSFHQNRFEGLFESFVVFQEGIAHAFLDFISQINKLLSTHLFRVFHMFKMVNAL